MAAGFSKSVNLTLGGPIYIPKLINGKNKLFWFFSYEGIHDAFPEPQTQTVATAAERRELLERHREQVRKHVAELQACLLVLDGKIAGYAGSAKRMKDDDARPIRARNPVRSGHARPL